MAIQNWKNFLMAYEQAIDELKVKLRSIRKEYRRRNEYSPIEFVTGRVKEVSSILEKANKFEIPLDRLEQEMEDIAGIRIMCQFVDDIDKVEKGSVIAVLGNSGSGKTTLLRCISFLEQADQGEITFDDFQKDITAVTRKEIKELRMKMGFVFQGYNLFRNKTALQNVLEGLTAARKIPVKGKIPSAQYRIKRTRIALFTESAERDQ